MTQQYVDLMDGNKLITVRGVAHKRKQRKLADLDSIPAVLHGDLKIAPLDVTIDHDLGHSAGVADLVSGQWVERLTPYTDDEKAAIASYWIQGMLDDLAKDMGYDNIHTAVTYADEPAVQKFQLEGQALRAHRSLCWSKAYEVLADAKAGSISEPTKEELIALMPAFAPPVIP